MTRDRSILPPFAFSKSNGFLRPMHFPSSCSSRRSEQCSVTALFKCSGSFVMVRMELNLSKVSSVMRFFVSARLVRMKRSKRRLASEKKKWRRLPNFSVMAAISSGVLVFLSLLSSSSFFAASPFGVFVFSSDAAAAVSSASFISTSVLLASSFLTSDCLSLALPFCSSSFLSSSFFSSAFAFLSAMVMPQYSFYYLTRKHKKLTELVIVCRNVIRDNPR
mmetsp:Transcript_12413/g.15528  ORF Transcript_12413/g.15528 Transcript_12413/m.15528 type:complete len:220 (+) Transcript_12413:965-1624(+)